MDAATIARSAIAQNPGRRFAIGRRSHDAEYTALAVYSEDAAEWRMVAGLLLDGTWAVMPGLLVDGQPIVSQWREVTS